MVYAVKSISAPESLYPFMVLKDINQWKNIELLAGDIDEWIVDIKDTDPSVYHRYTGRKNTVSIRNMKRLPARVPSEKILFRVSHIPGFNSDEDVRRSVGLLKDMGASRIDEFYYIQTKSCP